MISIIGLILSLSLIIFLAYKGYSTIITAPLVALLTLFLIGEDTNTQLMVHYTEVYMGGFANFVKNYFPIFLTGAIFAKLMEETLYAKSIANFITKNLGKNKNYISSSICWCTSYLWRGFFIYSCLRIISYCQCFV